MNTTWPEYIHLTLLWCRTKVCAYLTSHDSGGTSTVISGMPLLHRLHDFDSSEKNYKLSQYPTGLEPIACKPFFSEIANNYVRDIPHTDPLALNVHSNQSQKSRGLFGWFG